MSGAIARLKRDERWSWALAALTAGHTLAMVLVTGGGDLTQWSGFVVAALLGGIAHTQRRHRQTWEAWANLLADPCTAIITVGDLRRQLGQLDLALEQRRA